MGLFIVAATVNCGELCGSPKISGHECASKSGHGSIAGIAYRAGDCDILEMKAVMDFGWIVTLASETPSTPQLSFAREGGSGTPVPDLSIEVDNLDEVHQRAVAAGFAIEYGPVTEPWRVRLFCMRDPVGRLVNILSHNPR